MKKASNSSLSKVIISTMVLFLWNIAGNKLSDNLSLSKPATILVGTILFIMIIWIEMDFQTPKIQNGFAEHVKPILKYVLIVITVVITIINLYSLRYGINNTYFIFSSIFLYSIFGVFMVNSGLQLSKRSDTVRWISIWYFTLGAFCLSLMFLFVYEAFM